MFDHLLSVADSSASGREPREIQTEDMHGGDLLVKEPDATMHHLLVNTQVSENAIIEELIDETIIITYRSHR